MDTEMTQERKTPESRLARTTDPDELRQIAATVRRLARYVDESDKRAVEAIAQTAEQKAGEA